MPNINFLKQGQIFKVLLLGILILLGTASYSHVLADPSINDDNTTTWQVIPTITSLLHQRKEANVWGLTMEEYQHYQEVMNTTPSGHWYSQLDPAEVLALNAKDTDEMMKYAKLQAQAMHARVTQELLFDKLYAQAYRELYPNEKPIESPLAHPNIKGVSLKAEDRVWLFTSLHSPMTPILYHYLMSQVQQVPKAMLDIYFVDKDISQSQIKAWADQYTLNNIPFNQQLTLNKGDDRFQWMFSHKNIALPYVGIVHHQHFQPIDLSSLPSNKQNRGE